MASLRIFDASVGYPFFIFTMPVGGSHQDLTRTLWGQGTAQGADEDLSGAAESTPRYREPDKRCPVDHLGGETHNKRSLLRNRLPTEQAQKGKAYVRQDKGDSVSPCARCGTRPTSIAGIERQVRFAPLRKRWGFSVWIIGRHVKGVKEVTP